MNGVSGVDEFGSERLTTGNTVEVTGKVGTHGTRVLYVHEDDMPLCEGDHFRYLNGFNTQEPTEHGFYPEYGVVVSVESVLGEEYYHVSVDGWGGDVEGITPPDSG